ncbi:MAG TPA: hypothetical protein VFA43_11565 [Gemmatimonadaceae bacterium]|nr:hypothetical protein [Gemmatimonadaceae bacterium]
MLTVALALTLLIALGDAVAVGFEVSAQPTMNNTARTTGAYRMRDSRGQGGVRNR